MISTIDILIRSSIFNNLLLHSSQEEHAIHLQHDEFSQYYRSNLDAKSTVFHLQYDVIS